ncbi:MAG TPA: tyrosine-type recombinase/integrase [Aquaticitalea sp.]|nr:tyrosine-type recombinase/integrase [Aquaticitalea sp.]
MITLADAEYPVPMSEIQLKKRSRKASFTRRPHRTLLRLLYSSGLRMGETLSPPPADIKKDKGLIYIQGGKGSKDRRVPPSSQYLTELRKFYKGHQPGQYFFEGQNRLGNMKIKGKNMAHNLPNGNVIGVKYGNII